MIHYFTADDINGMIDYYFHDIHASIKQKEYRRDEVSRRFILTLGVLLARKILLRRLRCLPRERNTSPNAACWLVAQAHAMLARITDSSPLEQKYFMPSA